MVDAGFNVRTSAPFQRVSKFAAKYTVAILLLLVANTLSAEKPSIETYLSRNPIGLGEKVFLSIDIGYEDVEKVSIEKPEWPLGLVPLTGPTIRTFVDADDSDQPRKVRISYTFRADRLGRIAVSNQMIRAGDFSLETEPFVIGVGYWRNREVYIPLIGEWQVEEGPVVVGQSIRAVVMLRDMVEIPVVGTIDVVAPTGALIARSPEVGPLERRHIGNTTIYQLPVATFLVTPSRTGRIALSEARIQIGEAVAVAQSVAISVEPAPDEISSSGAVGTFALSLEASSEERHPGEEVAVLVRIEGRGNLNYLALPEPEVEGLVLSDRSLKEDIRVTYNGFDGSRSVRYRFLIQNIGIAAIEIPKFYWYDPDSESIEYEDEKRIEFVVRSPPVDHVDEGFPFTIELPPEIFAHNTTRLYNDAANYLWLIPGIIVILVLIVLKKSRIILVSIVVLIGAGQPEGDPQIDAAIEMYANGQYAEAMIVFGDILKRMPGNPGLHYNRGVASYRAGNYQLAIHSIRTAIEIVPNDKKYREFAEWANTELALPTLIHPVLRFNLDILYAIGMAALSLATVAFVAQIVKNRGVFVIVAILTGALGLLAFTSLGIIHVRNDRATGVIAEGAAEVRIIPRETAAVRQTLPAGTSLRIVDRAEEYLLVRTGDGSSGWVSFDAVSLDRIR